MKDNQIATKQLSNPFTPLLLKFYDPFHGLGTIGEGKWGYSKEDAVIINADDDCNKGLMEFIFAKERSIMECLNCYDLASYNGFEIVSQQIVHYGEKSYDIMTVKVHLQAPNNNGYYVTEFWFDITNACWGSLEPIS